MTEQHPEPAGNEQHQNALGLLNRIRAAYAAGKAEGRGTGSTIEATMLEVGLLLHMIDNQVVVASAVEMLGAADGWNSAVNYTADRLGGAGDIYRKSMIAANPYTGPGEMLMNLASTNTERPES